VWKKWREFKFEKNDGKYYFYTIVQQTLGTRFCSAFEYLNPNAMKSFIALSLSDRYKLIPIYYSVLLGYKKLRFLSQLVF